MNCNTFRVHYTHPSNVLVIFSIAFNRNSVELQPSHEQSTLPSQDDSQDLALMQCYLAHNKVRLTILQIYVKNISFRVASQGHICCCKESTLLIHNNADLFCTYLSTCCKTQTWTLHYWKNWRFRYLFHTFICANIQQKYLKSLI